MPFQYVRDDVTRRVRIMLSGPITVAELIASLERQLAEGTWLYGVLVDARSIPDGLTPPDVRLFVSRVRELVDAHGPRGPVAFVAKEAGLIGSAQKSVFFSGKTDFLEVFWDISEANLWLDEQMAQRTV